LYLHNFGLCRPNMPLWHICLPRRTINFERNGWKISPKYAYQYWELYTLRWRFILFRSLASVQDGIYQMVVCLVVETGSAIRSAPSSSSRSAVTSSVLATSRGCWRDAKRLPVLSWTRQTVLEVSSSTPTSTTPTASSSSYLSTSSLRPAVSGGSCWSYSGFSLSGCCGPAGR